MPDFYSGDYKDIPTIEAGVGGYYAIYSDKKIWYNNNMQFNKYKDSEEKYGISGSDDWMTLEDGNNKVRIVGEFVDYGEHFDNTKKKSFVCLGKEKCFYCQAGEKPRVRYLGWVIDRKDGKIKLLRFGHSVFKQIGALAVNDEYKFDELPNYDITIKKEGKGLDTEYHVTPAREDSEITEKELEEITKKVKDCGEIIENMKAKLEKDIENKNGDKEEEPPPPEE